MLDVVIDTENEQRSGRAEHRTGDAMMAVPTTILVLDGYKSTGGLTVPVLPTLVLGDH